jgi:hypothetical protein
MIAALPDCMERGAVVYTASEAFAGLGKAGLITLIVVSIIAIVTFVWIFRETGKRD